MQTRWNVFES